VAGQVFGDDGVARLRAGARPCLTQASKAAPLMAPSSTIGAMTPSWRKAAIKVLVFQWPKGAAPTSRVPRGLRP
jgi:hypothetical protein